MQSGFGKKIENWVGRELAYPDNVLHLATECSNRGHSATFPVELPAWFIKLFTQPGDVVLDPFSGTFTTCFVAKELNRKCIGIELQDEYVRIGLRRLQLAKEYKGEKLEKEIRTFETEKIATSQNLKLFEDPNGTCIHRKH